MNPSLTEIWLISMILMTSGIILLVTLQLSIALKKLTKSVEQEDTRTWWEKFKGLNPLEKEKELEMEHTYDGIVELDNPTPPWFMYLFYLTIVFAGIYIFYYHILSDQSLTQTEEYAEEMSIGEKEKEAYLKKFANSITEENVQFLTQKTALDEGAKIYATNCVACHGDKGQGGVGPNLTDKFWIHGSKPNQLFHTVTNGIPEKGMIAWNKTLNPIQVQKVISYIVSLQGSNPPGAKEAQGTEE